MSSHRVCVREDIHAHPLVHMQPRQFCTAFLHHIVTGAKQGGSVIYGLGSTVGLRDRLLADGGEANDGRLSSTAKHAPAHTPAPCNTSRDDHPSWIVELARRPTMGGTQTQVAQGRVQRRGAGAAATGERRAEATGEGPEPTSLLSENAVPEGIASSTRSIHRS